MLCPLRRAFGRPALLPSKRAIYLFMSGAPPQMDLLDYKPNLAQLYDKDLPDSVRGAQQLTGMTAGQASFPIAPSHWAFKQYGKTGTWVSDLLLIRRAWSMTSPLSSRPTPTLSITSRQSCC